MMLHTKLHTVFVLFLIKWMNILENKIAQHNFDCFIQVKNMR